MQGPSYSDAVTLLDGEKRLVNTLDRLSGGLLLALSGSGVMFALSLFDPKGDLSKISGQILASALERKRGLTRFKRTERLRAAHSVIVVAAFFDTAREARFPPPVQISKLTSTDQMRLVKAVPSGENLAAVARALLHAELPMPTPERPFEDNLEALDRLYRASSRRVLDFLSGLAGWDQLNETERGAVERELLENVPRQALARYEESFLRLATELPEVALWAHHTDHQANRERLTGLSVGMMQLEAIVSRLGAGQDPDTRRRELFRYYGADLLRPIIAAGEAPAGITIPQLSKAYVSPDFRVGRVDKTQDIVREKWWTQHAVRHDLEVYLAGHLTSATATRAPLLVLGQPGSGKSVFTRILAARLPPEQFLVIRVVLRDVAADADIQAHIEHAIRSSTGDALAWPELARTCGDALPVLLFDGFDELLQAAGVTQTDYLERVAAFQRREAAIGRPVVAVVTSRIAVADRARSPEETVALRLEPFREAQVETWLNLWNAVNADALAARGVRPLPASVAMKNSELSSQPLLLMMIALYDADANALQNAGPGLGYTDLYESLLRRFAEREVRKDAPSLGEPELTAATETELLRLSVIAFSMFNRGRQWVTEEELDSDLAILLGEQPRRPSRPVGLRAPLGEGERAVGRFFFINQNSALRGGQSLRSYEFLHATFGEYLVGRLVSKELADLAKIIETNRDLARPVEIDSVFLRSLLSFTPFTARNTTVNFLREIIDGWPEDRRRELCGPLATLFGRSRRPPLQDAYAGYAPWDSDAPTRAAAYSCNVTLLLIILGRGVKGSELFPEFKDVRHEWRALAMLWCGHLKGDNWLPVARLLVARRIWTGDIRDLHIDFRDDHTEFPSFDLFWPYHLSRQDAPYEPYPTDELRLWMSLLGDKQVDTVAHVAEPFFDHLPEALVAFHVKPGEESMVSAANALVSLIVAARGPEHIGRLCALYDTCLAVTAGALSGEKHDRTAYFGAVLRSLVADLPLLPQAWTSATTRQIGLLQAESGDAHTAELLSRVERALA